MLLADGRRVPDLPLDRTIVDRCRALADKITAQVLEFVGRHTTVSIERTVLRLYGLHDAGPRGVPLVNLAVDALHERRLLGRGAAYWMKRVSTIVAMSGTVLMIESSSSRSAASLLKPWSSPAKNLRFASRFCQRR